MMKVYSNVMKSKVISCEGILEKITLLFIYIDYD